MISVSLLCIDSCINLSPSANLLAKALIFKPILLPVKLFITCDISVLSLFIDIFKFKLGFSIWEEISDCV